MPVEHINRRGDKYVLQSGKTKTGKPKYWFGRQLTGAPVEALPDGYEIHERPADSQVFLRKRAPSPISEVERECLADGIRKHAGLKHFLIDVHRENLIVYLPDRDPMAVAALFGKLFGGATAMQENEQWTAAHVRYSKMMQFTLVDEDERLFTLERWCFLGSIDQWIYLAGPSPLEKLIAKYAPHLGKESFFELM